MKPWQTLSNKNKPVEKTTAPPPTMEDQVKAVSFLLASSQALWKGIGKKKPQAAQFIFSDAPDASWYVEIDADGGRAKVGRHARPDVQWESDLEAFDAAFQGKLLEGRIRIVGEYEILQNLFRALSQTNLPR